MSEKEMINEWMKDFTKIWKEDKWLYFELIDEKPPWRHYCFFPIIEEEIVYSDRCLLSIAKFITELNVKHKGQLK